jgi:hypothetical protein
VPIARLGHEVFRVTLLALVGFAVLRWLAERFSIPGLRAALGASGTAT